MTCVYCLCVFIWQIENMHTPWAMTFSVIYPLQWNSTILIVDTYLDVWKTTIDFGWKRLKHDHICYQHDSAIDISSIFLNLIHERFKFSNCCFATRYIVLQTLYRWIKVNGNIKHNGDSNWVKAVFEKTYLNTKRIPIKSSVAWTKYTFELFDVLFE